MKLEQEKTYIIQAQKKPKQFEPLYNAYYKDVYAFVYTRAQDHYITKDITSETFFKAITNINQFKTFEYSIKNWFLRIALNALKHHFNQEKRERKYAIAASELKEINQEIKLDSQIEKTRLIEGLNQLDDEALEIIEMKYYEKRSHQEISVIKNISIQNSKVKLHRAIQKLSAICNLKHHE